MIEKWKLISTFDRIGKGYESDTREKDMDTGHDHKTGTRENKYGCEYYMCIKQIWLETNSTHRLNMNLQSFLHKQSINNLQILTFETFKHCSHSRKWR